MTSPLLDRCDGPGSLVKRSLVLIAYGELIRFGIHVRRKDFAALHAAVRNCQVRTAPRPGIWLADLCRAVDIACVWYWRRVLCLQRSAAATCLFRRYGLRAQLVIGTQKVPFNAHAWVEVGGQIVTDRPYMHEMYIVLERI